MRQVPPISDEKLADFDAIVNGDAQGLLAGFLDDPGTVLEIKRSQYKLYDEALKETHNGQCAFCQLKIADGYAAVEHYRPKKGPLKNEDKLDEMIPHPLGEEHEPIPHPGYFWLAYNGKNLLYACTTCNTPKSNKFPIKRSRAKPPLELPGIDELVLEEPVILNPTQDPVEDHIELGPDFHLIGLSDRGDITIEILNLNREPLVERRKKAFEDACGVYALFIDAAAQAVRLQDGIVSEGIKRIAQEKVDKILSGEVECSMAGKYGLTFAHNLHTKVTPELEL